MFSDQPNKDSRVGDDCGKPLQTDTEAIFLAAIRQNLDDDRPRLAYADWLDARGEPRGEFIRLQCGLARFRIHDLRMRLQTRKEAVNNLGWIGRSYPDYAALARHELALLETFGADWGRLFKPLGKSPRAERNSHIPSNWMFRRGFVESVFVFPRLLSLAIELIASSTEPVRHVWVWAASDFEGQGTGGRVCLGNNGCGILSNARGLEAIQSLHLRYAEISPAGIHRLTCSAAFPSLGTLDLHSNKIRSMGAMMLGESHLLSKLAVLDLGNNDIGDSGARAIAESPYSRRLRVLNLSSNNLTDEGALALAASAHFRSLECLHISNNSIGPDGTRALLRLRERTPLRVLQLKKNKISVEDFAGELEVQTAWHVRPCCFFRARRSPHRNTE